MNPAIVLVSEARSDQLLDEFGRCSRDDELPTATSAHEAKLAAKRGRRRERVGRAARPRP